MTSRGSQDWEQRLELIITDARQRRAVWLDRTMIAGGLPLRARAGAPYRGTNILVLWDALRRDHRAGPAAWLPCSTPETSEPTLFNPPSRGVPVVHFSTGGQTGPARRFHRVRLATDWRVDFAPCADLSGQQLTVPDFAATDDQALQRAETSWYRELGETTAEALIQELARALFCASTGIPLPVLAPEDVGRLCARTLPRLASLAQQRVDSALDHLDLREELEQDWQSAATPPAPPTPTRRQDEREPTPTPVVVLKPTPPTPWQLGIAVQQALTHPGANRVFGYCLSTDAHRSWARLRRNHVRSTWLHQLHWMRPADLKRSGVPVAARASYLQDLDPGLALTDVGGLIGRRQYRLPPALDEGAYAERLRSKALPRAADPTPSSRNRSFNRSLRKKVTHPEPDVDLERPPAFVYWAGVERLLFDSDKPPYEERFVPKRSGGVRHLHVPSSPLARVQRDIAQTLAAWFLATSSMAAFHPGRRTAWHVRIHEGARQAVIMDIKDFFGSIRASAVRRWISGTAQPGVRPYGDGPFADFSSTGVDLLARLLMLQTGGVAQGAPSSPILANLVGHEIDRYAQNLIRAHLPDVPFRYSRYADDIVVTTEADAPTFLEVAPRMIAGAMSHHGFRPNRSKTRLWTRGKLPLIVCGAHVPSTRGGTIRLTRTLRRRARAALHRLSTMTGDDDNRDRGLLAYVYDLTGDPRYVGFLSAAAASLCASTFSSDPDDLHSFRCGMAGLPEP